MSLKVDDKVTDQDMQLDKENGTVCISVNEPDSGLSIDVWIFTPPGSSIDDSTQRARRIADRIAATINPA